MKIAHILGKKWEKEANEASFLLNNNLGDYLWLADIPTSRYQGWFFAPDKAVGSEVYKVIEDMRPLERDSVTSIYNYFSKVERTGNNFWESFSVAKNGHVMVYKTGKKQKIELILDMRKSYSDDYPNYQVEQEEGKIIVKASSKEEEIFLVIAGFDNFEFIGERFVRYYSFDKKRSSPPFEKAVYKLGMLEGNEIVFSVSDKKNKALSELETKKNFDVDLDNQDPIDYIAAKNGLLSLVVEDRIYAGLPWFFQFWKRDEAISLGGLSIIDKEKSKKVFWNLLADKTVGPKEHHLADGIGWTFKRAYLFLNDFDSREEKILINYLRKEIDLNFHGLVISDQKETWMDSIQREGARIEIQALELAMYKLGKLVDKENSKQFAQLEVDLRKRVREVFWDGNILADGYLPETGKLDKTVRPNIFLAYYIYPELLEDEEWKNCFRRALYQLWLGWGGLASISKEDPRFNNVHTGENSQSYHQGDSWFFINNLAAIAMHRLDGGKFSYEINKILEASRNDLMWKGAIGHHSELSSAETLRPEGAISQAWSFATYLEALHEIFKIKNFDWL